MSKSKIKTGYKTTELTVYIVFTVLISGITGCGKSGNLSNRHLNECEQIAELKQIGNHWVTVVDASLLKDTVELPLSYFIEELHIVKLDDKEEALVAPTSVIVGDQHILINGRMSGRIPVKLFDKSGKFITNIGAFGGGPNEYVQLIYSMQLDEKNNRIYLLQLINDKILAYDLTGNHLDFISLPSRIGYSEFRVNSRDGSVSVFMPPTLDARFSMPYCVWAQRMSGEIIHGIAPDVHRVGINENEPFAIRISNRNNTKELDIHIYGDASPRRDTLYHYNSKNNELIPKFTVDFGNREIPVHKYFDFPFHYLGYSYELHEVEGLPGSYISTNPVNFIVEKETLKGATFKLINDFLGNIEINWPCETFIDGYYRANYDPSSLLEILENALINNEMSAEMREKITDLKSSISENDNNYILYGKLKE
jgi:hypothetical protein